MIEPIDTEIETPLTINETIAKLQCALRDYIEATYHVSDPILVSQRKKLLEQEGSGSIRSLIWRVPRAIRPVPSSQRYQV